MTPLRNSLITYVQYVHCTTVGLFSEDDRIQEKLTGRTLTHGIHRKKNYNPGDFLNPHPFWTLDLGD